MFDPDEKEGASERGREGRRVGGREGGIDGETLKLVTQKMTARAAILPRTISPWHKDTPTSSPCKRAQHVTAEVVGGASGYMKHLQRGLTRQRWSVVSQRWRGG